MPTYDYKCKECGHVFELFQSISDDPCDTCPVCKGAVKRMLGTGAGLIFKGSGFYATDYRSSTYKAAETKDKSETSKEPAEKSSMSNAVKSETSSTAEKTNN